MKRTWEILKREYLENVRTKAFLVGVLLTPVWMSLAFFLPTLMDKPERERVVIVDATGILAEPLRAQLEASSRPSWDVQVHAADGAWTADAKGQRPVDGLLEAAGRGEHFVVLITPATLAKRPPAQGEPEGLVAGPSGAGALQTARLHLQRRVNDLVNHELARARGLKDEDVRLLERDAIPYRPVDEKGKQVGPASMLAPLIFMMLLFMGIVGISQMLISSTLEEKSNRVFELLLSSVSPFQLMLGKILGICGVGFTLLLIWSGGGVLAASVKGMDELVSAPQLGFFLLYYVLGFVLIASLMVAVGSACNTIKEAQNLMAPISLLLALPLLLSVTVIGNPNGTVATVLSFIPPFTPFLMMLRISSVPAPSTLEILASILLLAGSTWIAVRLAARVFRVGILLHGQPPSIRQIFTWLYRSPD